ncbi:MAG: hypothetical protein K0Q73_3239 [Paenibacillus sp.]|jgi:hypothetical protein|nr:hypothetical protein [Paenibacillus sp.]
MKTVAVIGGFKIETIETMAEKKGGVIKLMFHNGKIKSKQGVKKLENIVKQSDCIILMKDACSHQAMWDTKSLSKHYNKPIFYQNGIGASAALERASLFLTFLK